MLNSAVTMFYIGIDRDEGLFLARFEGLVWDPKFQIRPAVEIKRKADEEKDTKIHSMRELRQFKVLALDAKARGVKLVSALLKSMLERNVFLFGCVGLNEGSATQRVNELRDVQNARVQTAYKKLFANSRLEHFLYMDLGTELDVDLLKKRSSDYALAKEIAIKEGGQVIDVQDIRHIIENKRLIGVLAEKTATNWNSQKELFYEQTGMDPLTVAVPPKQDENEHVLREGFNENTEHKEPCDNVDNENNEEEDNFDKELEVMLFQPLECDNGEAESENSWEEDT
ncbi:hypothetical protein OROMI_018721 [Orobanche minor]